MSKSRISYILISTTSDRLGRVQLVPQLPIMIISQQITFHHIKLPADHSAGSLIFYYSLSKTPFRITVPVNA